MKVRLARISGYCMGVRRAVEMALEALHSRQGPIYSYGPLIHNPQAMALLESKGLITIAQGIEGMEGINGGSVIIRAHGVPPQERQALEERGLDIIDATCPRVIRVQAIIKRHTNLGYSTLIWGNENHPEVIGLLGHADGRGLVIQEPEEVAGLPDLDRVILVAQTTQNLQKAPEIQEAVLARWPEALIFDTICGATQRRQDEVRRLAHEVQVMVVVGGHDSGNTRRLAAVAEAEGLKTIHVETEDELDPDFVGAADVVGVTAGASTPNWMIKRVMRKLERLARKKSISVRTVAHRLLRIAIITNVYVAAGAGVLCLAGAMLQDLAPRIDFFAVTFFYVQAMHMLNLFLDKEASQFNDPDRVMFLEKHRTVLLTTGVASALLGLGLSIRLGLPVFLMLMVMSILGLLYAVPLAPRAWADRVRFRRLKDIPASKTLSVSGGWAMSLGLVPVLAPGGRLTAASGLVILVIFTMVFIRSGLGDILEIQGDRIVGRETIPIMIGEQKTLNLLMAMTAILAVMFLGGFLTGLLTSLALALLICAGYSATFLIVFKRARFIGSAFFEALVDANFLLAGLLSWIWWMARGG